MIDGDILNRIVDVLVSLMLIVFACYVIYQICIPQCISCGKKKVLFQYHTRTVPSYYNPINNGGICKRCVKHGKTVVKDGDGDFYVYYPHTKEYQFVYQEDVKGEPRRLRFKSREE